MSKEDGELVKRKMKWAGVSEEEVGKELKVSPLLMKMFLSGEVLQKKFSDELKELMMRKMVNKYGRKFLGNCLKEKRESKGLTQVELARRFGVSHDVIFKLEKGDSTIGDHYEKIFKMLEKK